MTSRAFNTSAFALIIILTENAGCGQLKPEATKTRTPEITYQYARVDATYDVATDSWNYAASLALKTETAVGEATTLTAGESIVINGETVANSGSTAVPMYYISKSGTPPSTFSIVWTASNGTQYANTCSWENFLVSGVPTTQSRASGFDVVLTFPTATGTANGNVFQQVDNTYRSSDYVYKTISSASTPVTMNFLSSHLAKVSAGESSLNISWENSSPLTNATVAGGVCSVSITKKYSLTLSN